MRFLIKIKSFFVIILLVGFSCSSFATNQQPTYSFQSTISADSIIIGDQVELTIKALLPKGYQVQFPFFADTIVTGIEVLGRPIIDTLNKRSGESEFTYRLKITSFEEGYYRIPQFKLPFTNGETNDTAQTSPIWFLVNTLQPDSTMATIYDIKMPYAEPLTFAEVAPWVGGSILLAGIIALLIIYLIKRKKGEVLFFPAKPADPPHVVALRELEKIKDQKLWNTDRHKHYHTVLTDVIRNYIEGRYSVPAMEQTTDETIRSLKRDGVLDSELLDGLQETLSLADLVKFAKFTPDISENEAGLEFGFKLVNETKIEVVEEEASEKPASEPNKEDEKPKALPVEPIKTNEL